MRDDEIRLRLEARQYVVAGDTYCVTFATLDAPRGMVPNVRLMDDRNRTLGRSSTRRGRMVVIPVTAAGLATKVRLRAGTITRSIQPDLFQEVA